jgi:hypothetical protein
VEIKSNEIKIVSVDSIIKNPKNPNTHSQAQIDRLCKLIKNTGFRNPLIISNKSGFLIVGHGRLEAAMKLGMNSVPVIFQDFKNEADEYAYMTADNAVGSWSELDLEKIKIESLEFENLDMEMLGLENFSILGMVEEDIEEEKEESEKKLILQVELPNEMELRDLYDDLLQKGYMVKEL